MHAEFETRKMQMSEEETKLRDGRSNARELAVNGQPIVGTLLGLAGGIGGGVLGYFLFILVTKFF